VNYKPLIYLENQDNELIDYECGQLILVNCNYVTVQNLRITKTDTGIILNSCNNCIISGNDVFNSRGGILLANCVYNNVSYNDLYQNIKYGIRLYGSDYNSIEHNYCTEHLLGEFSYHGISLSGSDNNTIRYNILKDNHVGLGCSSCDDNIISENVVTDNTYVGMSFRPLCEDNYVERNIIRGNGMGIWLDDVSFNEIVKNDFYDNDEDMSIWVIQYYDLRLRHMIHISGNYWGKARILPMFILGKFTYIFSDVPWGGGITINWLYIDRKPARGPNNVD
jgi:parallel beta-helix repeat protein